jgi:hypothetical protein
VAAQVADQVAAARAHDRVAVPQQRRQALQQAAGRQRLAVALAGARQLGHQQQGADQHVRVVPRVQQPAEIQRWGWVGDGMER